jgi:hypothetical protein
MDKSYKIVLTLCFLWVCVIGKISSSDASVWQEYHNAGSLPSNSQEVLGNGELEAIRGTITGLDIDMFKIFITYSFRASTEIPLVPCNVYCFG